ncbi:MAG: roadblock/LC7 domain-containing protein [Promethearchaeota archaeon]
MPVTLGQKIIKELKIQALTISQLSEILKKDEPTIRTTINRLKEKKLVMETGDFEERYKVYKIADKSVNAILALKILMNIKGVKAVNLVTSEGIPVDSILPDSADPKDEMKYAAMTSAVVSLGERACRETKKGNLNLSLIEGELGKLLVVGCGPDFVISLSLDDTISNKQLFSEYFKTVEIVRSTLIDLREK